MTAAKASVVFLSDRVAPRTRGPYVAMLSLVAIWSVYSFFAIAFRCALPRPWTLEPSECPSSGPLQYPVVILNLITDFMLATWILPTLWKLLMDTDKRVTVMALFGSRLLQVCDRSTKIDS
jgi:hypothetical protein